MAPDGANSAAIAERVQGPARVSRDLPRAFVGDSAEQHDTPNAEAALPIVVGAPGRFDRRTGAPSGAFLAQHLAQEVMDTEPGFDAHRAGTRAYLNTRESTVELTTGGAGFDLRV